jgi:hypothetical protein
MKRVYPEKLSADLIRRALCVGEGGEAMAAHFRESEAIEAWKKVLGPLANYSTGLELREGMLRVRITSPMLRSDLFMQRAALVEKLNNAIGRKLVKGITFY